MESSQTAHVNGRDVEYVLKGQGTPAVVFENGLGGSMEWWETVLPAVAQKTTAFAYNRPGVGKSDPATTPRDGTTIVEELRATLLAQGIKPPYLLVGHSIGGLYTQLFARLHPDEVAGLVLVDSTHPNQLSGAGARENWPFLFTLAMDLTAPAVAEDELDALPATGQSLLKLPPFVGKPVTVLSAREPMKETSALALDSNAKRVDIVRLNPGSKQVWVDCGHAIPMEKPEAIIEAIDEMLANQKR